MKCPKCNSSNFDAVCRENEIFEKRKLSLISNILMTTLTLGLWIIIPAIGSYQRRKIKSRIVYICKDCGHEFTKKEAII